MTTPGGYVSNEVIAIKLDALVIEVQQLRRELVRADVYEAERRADALELKAVKDQMETMRSELAAAGQRRWGLWIAAAAGGLSLLWKLFENLVQAQG